MLDDLRINSDRMLAVFNDLAQIGSTGEGGVNRPALSEAHLAARKWFRAQIEKAGLEFRQDGAGNHSAFLACGARDATTLLLGSHLDSVPKGGRFDGALGVTSAFEVLQTIKDAGIKLKVNLEAIDFTDEEGTLVGLLGSAALAGGLHAEMLKNPRGGLANLVEGMQRAGLDERGILTAGRPAGTLAGYLELHIEQGKRLERSQVNIGIVSAIVGISSYLLTFVGRADHAGSSLMDDRLDASLGASAFTLAAREIVMRDFRDCVVNVGRMEFSPGAFNIVPERVDVSLEFRAPGEDEFERLDSALLERAESEARRFGLGLKKVFLGKHLPTRMSAAVQGTFAAVCEGLALTDMPLVSGAGHDAQSLARICPVGMIFVPSRGGRSHSLHEFTDWADCVNGANVLLHTALRLAA